MEEKRPHSPQPDFYTEALQAFHVPEPGPEEEKTQISASQKKPKRGYNRLSLLAGLLCLLLILPHLQNLPGGEDPVETTPGSGSASEPAASSPVVTDRLEIDTADTLRFYIVPGLDISSSVTMAVPSNPVMLTDTASQTLMDRLMQLDWVEADTDDKAATDLTSQALRRTLGHFSFTFQGREELFVMYPNGTLLWGSATAQPPAELLQLLFYYMKSGCPDKMKESSYTCDSGYGQLDFLDENTYRLRIDGQVSTGLYILRKDNLILAEWAPGNRVFFFMCGIEGNIFHDSKRSYQDLLPMDSSTFFYPTEPTEEVSNVRLSYELVTDYDQARPGNFICAVSETQTLSRQDYNVIRNILDNCRWMDSMLSSKLVFPVGRFVLKEDDSIQIYTFSADRTLILDGKQAVLSNEAWFQLMSVLSGCNIRHTGSYVHREADGLWVLSLRQDAFDLLGGSTGVLFTSGACLWVGEAAYLCDQAGNSLYFLCDGVDLYCRDQRLEGVSFEPDSCWEAQRIIYG